MTASTAAIASLRDIRFGVEVEFTGATRNRVAEAVAFECQGTVVSEGGYYQKIAIVMPDGRKWTVMTDASVNGSHANRGGELVTPIMTYADLDLIQRVIRAVRKSRGAGENQHPKGAGAKVDASCGIHIHVDGANFTSGQQVSNLVGIVNKQQNLICNALAIQSDRRARWCQDISPELLRRLQNDRPSTLEEVRSVWYASHGENPAYAAGEHYARSRYHGVNIHSLFFRGTVEFRWFEASLHAGEVKAYIQFILALTYKALTMRRPANAAPRVSNPDNTKWEFRVFLKDLGLVGEEFETCRFHLLKNLTGSSRTRIVRD